MKERVILVAFHLEAGDDRPSYEFEEALTSFFAKAKGRTPMTLSSPTSASPVITEWWVAEDSRQDGSDNDSAVFVNYGSQADAFRLLHEEGLSGSWNRAHTSTEEGR